MSEQLKQISYRLCTMLAELFGDSLDRLTLWARIGSALSTSVAKVSDGDLERFVNLCLEHVQADPAQAAACNSLSQLLADFEGKPPEWRQGLLNYIGSHLYPILAHGRARWQEVKKGTVEA